MNGFAFSCLLALTSQEAFSSQHIDKHSQLLRELKERFESKEEITPTQCPKSSISATLDYLNNHSSTPLTSLTAALQHSLKNLVILAQGNVKQKQAAEAMASLSPFLEEIAHHEIEECGEYDVVYHGTGAESAFLFELYKVIGEVVNMERSHGKLRSSAHTYKTIQEFFEDPENIASLNNPHFDHNDKVRFNLISASLSPFQYYPGESTLYFYTHGRSVLNAKAFFPILETILQNLNFTPEMMEKYKDLLTEMSQITQRVMLQIFIKKEFSDKIMYAAYRYGQPYYTHENKIFFGTRNFLEAYRQNSLVDFVSKNINSRKFKQEYDLVRWPSLQVRLLATSPYLFKKNAIKTYAYYPPVIKEKIKQIQAKLAQFVQADVISLLEKTPISQKKVEGFGAFGKLYSYYRQAELAQSLEEMMSRYGGNQEDLISVIIKHIQEKYPYNRVAFNNIKDNLIPNIQGIIKIITSSEENQSQDIGQIPTFYDNIMILLKEKKYNNIYQALNKIDGFKEFMKELFFVKHGPKSTKIIQGIESFVTSFNGNLPPIDTPSPSIKNYRILLESCMRKYSAILETYMWNDMDDLNEKITQLKSTVHSISVFENTPEIQSYLTSNNEIKDLSTTLHQLQSKTGP